jgi:hypothetical protein
MLSSYSHRLSRTIASPLQTSSVLYSPMNTDLLKLEAQAALDELRNKGLLPFALEARMLVSEGSQHTIRFYDSRLHSITVSYEEGQSFKEIVRAAVLDRVSELK